MTEQSTVTITAKNLRKPWRWAERLGMWARDRSGARWIFRLIAWWCPEGPWWSGYTISIDGQIRTITTYDPTNDTVTISAGFTCPPSESVFRVFPRDTP